MKLWMNEGMVENSLNLIIQRLASSDYVAVSQKVNETSSPNVSGLHSQMTQSRGSPGWPSAQGFDSRQAEGGDGSAALARRFLGSQNTRPFHGLIYQPPIRHLTIIHSRAELKNTSLTTSRPKQLHWENHVFQQLNHFSSPSPGLSFGWREIVERLAGGDGSPQHRCPWTTLTTSHG